MKRIIALSILALGLTACSVPIEDGPIGRMYDPEQGIEITFQCAKNKWGDPVLEECRIDIFYEEASR